ncbi:hypothetical protein [Ureibacillus acetophenoni]|uniref:Uncharacterized protein n=1 Tax=Ureibacillus acetophenoni TaxID=614649 RepID=A0A285UT50_9BACL|nr:hypothetical protein [Ureibacillus acetophenoni]SOC45020.1 hypothetical protein SAMN05877842_1277 [Ureibacillus acetophenoni]
MNIVVWLIMIGMFLYTIGFSIELWRQKNKSGAIAVCILAISIIIAPFFSVLSW